jgi:type IV pilus assembly protein PilA
MSSRARAAVFVAALVALVSLGVLAAVAIPAYRDYTIRAQISEGLRLAAPYKDAVVAAWRSNGQRFADIRAESFGPVLEHSGKHVRSVDVVSGAIVITYGEAASAALRGRSLTIVPALNDEDAVAWQCGHAAAPAGFEPIFDAPSRLTDVPEEYLPSGCRR